MITTLIRSHPKIQDSIVQTLPEIERMKSEISFLKRKLYDLKLYSRKNCLVFSGISEPKDGKENTDQIALNIINNYTYWPVPTTPRWMSSSSAISIHLALNPNQECESSLETLL